MALKVSFSDVGLLDHLDELTVTQSEDCAHRGDPRRPSEARTSMQGKLPLQVGANGRRGECLQDATRASRGTLPTRASKSPSAAIKSTSSGLFRTCCGASRRFVAPRAMLRALASDE